MKKIFAIALVLVMMLAMSVTAFAYEPMISATGQSTQTEIVVTNEVTENDAANKVYAVDVEWNLDFSITTTVNNSATWDPENHVYSEGDIVSTLNQNSGTVKVTNHSNDKIKATLSHSADTAGILNITVDGASDITIADASAGESYGNFGNAPEGEFTLKVTLIGNTNTTETSFTATVTITAAP